MAYDDNGHITRNGQEIFNSIEYTLEVNLSRTVVSVFSKFLILSRILPPPPSLPPQKRSEGGNCYIQVKLQCSKSIKINNCLNL